MGLYDLLLCVKLCYVSSCSSHLNRFDNSSHPEMGVRFLTVLRTSCCSCLGCRLRGFPWQLFKVCTVQNGCHRCRVAQKATSQKTLQRLVGDGGSPTPQTDTYVGEGNRVVWGGSLTVTLCWPRSENTIVHIPFEACVCMCVCLFVRNHLGHFFILAY